MDIKRQINALVSAGLSETKIADMVDVDQSTINRIRHGKIADPKYSLAMAIDRVWRAECGKRK